MTHPAHRASVLAAVCNMQSALSNGHAVDAIGTRDNRESDRRIRVHLNTEPASEYSEGITHRSAPISASFHNPQ